MIMVMVYLIRLIYCILLSLFTPLHRYAATGTVAERRKNKGVKVKKKSEKAILLETLRKNKGKTSTQRKVEANRSRAHVGKKKKR